MDLRSLGRTGVRVPTICLGDVEVQASIAVEIGSYHPEPVAERLQQAGRRSEILEAAVAEVVQQAIREGTEGGREAASPRFRKSWAPSKLVTRRSTSPSLSTSPVAAPMP